MIINIKSDKVRSMLFNDKFYDTNVPFEGTFSDALRLARLTPIETIYDRVPYDPSLWKDHKKINFTSDVDSVSGWGNVSTNLIKYSPDIEFSVVGALNGVTDAKVRAAVRRPLEQAGAMIWHEQPRGNWQESPFEKNIAIVPFETTIIPKSWINRINGFDALLVPCQQNVDAFRNSGVKIPIEIIHWGVDETKFYPLEREDDGIFTFGTMGSLSIRKGTDILVQAFKIAFPVEKDVRLICKTSNYAYMFNDKDKRIEVQMSPVSHDELIESFFKRVDCFVFPTRGEGFGLPPLEAMATGIPSIATGWSGINEFLNDDVGYVIDHTMEDASDFRNVIYKEDCGQWAKPDIDHLVRIMRHAYENQDEVKEKGKKAAQYVKDHWLWKDKIKMFHDALNKYL